MQEERQQKKKEAKKRADKELIQQTTKEEESKEEGRQEGADVIKTKNVKNFISAPFLSSSSLSVSLFTPEEFYISSLSVLFFLACLSSYTRRILYQFLVCPLLPCLSLFLHPRKTFFAESTCALLFACVSSHWWIHFPGSVLFCQPHQQLFTLNSKQLPLTFRVSYLISEHWQLNCFRVFFDRVEL